MTLQDILLGGSGGLLLLLTLIQIAPIKINPWSRLARAIGKAINSDVLKEINDIKKAQETAKEQLEKHIKSDFEHNADMRRANILTFNNELLREIPHTREEFIEILSDIDYYERYCKEHPDYSNSHAVHAIANIDRVYDERLQKHDFL